MIDGLLAELDRFERTGRAPPAPDRSRVEGAWHSGRVRSPRSSRAIQLTAVARVIGLPTKTVRRGSTVGLHGGADAALPTAGPLPPPWRYDDHYGFNSLSCIE